MSMKEFEASTVPGIGMLLFLIAVVLGGAYGLVVFARHAEPPDRGILVTACVLLLTLALIGFSGFFTVAPNQASVLQLFGRYMGSVKKAGLHWANPFFSKHKVSLRVRNFETARLKVNDHDGNPIEIGAVVVWKVVDSAEASFEVDNYDNFVHVQSESALRNLATSYAYDAHEDGKMSLRGNTDEVAAQLKREIETRVAKAGIDVIESRISHLAYAPEIAMAMLQRQQASAIIAARQKIVEGAVGMVEMALELLSLKGVIQLDEERKAAMVSNLLVVLCGERATQPVINAGTIYQ
jgi:hypothetical protein